MVISQCSGTRQNHRDWTLATQRKEELQMEIERQRELGTEGLLEEDGYLATSRVQPGGSRGDLGYEGDLLATCN